jgi:acetyl-CoA C-acetyltransferase
MSRRISALANHLVSGSSVDEYRIPIIVGAASITKPPHQGHKGGFLPSDLATEAVLSAINDASASDIHQLKASIDAMAMPFHRNEPTSSTTRKVAEMCGIDLPPNKDFLGGPGSSGQLYVNAFCKEICEGVEKGVACVMMAEARHSFRLVRKAGKRWEKDTVDRGKPRTLRICDMPGKRPGEDTQQLQEQEHGFTTPNWCYSLYDNALRASAGRSVPDHVTHMYVNTNIKHKHQIFSTRPMTNLSAFLPLRFVLGARYMSAIPR